MVGHLPFLTTSCRKGARAMSCYSSGCRSFRYDSVAGVVYRSLGFLGFRGYRVGDDGSVWSNRVSDRYHPEARGPWKKIKGKATKYGYRRCNLSVGSKRSEERRV